MALIDVVDEIGLKGVTGGSELFCTIDFIGVEIVVEVEEIAGEEEGGRESEGGEEVLTALVVVVVFVVPTSDGLLLLLSLVIPLLLVGLLIVEGGAMTMESELVSKRGVVTGGDANDVEGTVASNPIEERRLFDVLIDGSVGGDANAVGVMEEGLEDRPLFNNEPVEDRVALFTAFVPLISAPAH